MAEVFGFEDGVDVGEIEGAEDAGEEGGEGPGVVFGGGDVVAAGENLAEQVGGQLVDGPADEVEGEQRSPHGNLSGARG